MNIIDKLRELDIIEHDGGAGVGIVDCYMASDVLALLEESKEQAPVGRYSLNGTISGLKSELPMNTPLYSYPVTNQPPYAFELSIKDSRCITVVDKYNPVPNMRNYVDDCKLTLLFTHPQLSDENVKDGYVMVPIEPTQEMVKAAESLDRQLLSKFDHVATVQQVYRKMIDEAMKAENVSKQEAD